MTDWDLEQSKQNLRNAEMLFAQNMSNGAAIGNLLGAQTAHAMVEMAHDMEQHAKQREALDEDRRQARRQAEADEQREEEDRQAAALSSMRREAAEASLLREKTLTDILDVINTPLGTASFFAQGQFADQLIAHDSQLILSLMKGIDDIAQSIGALARVAARLGHAAQKSADELAAEYQKELVTQQQSRRFRAQKSKKNTSIAQEALQASVEYAKAQSKEAKRASFAAASDIEKAASASTKGAQDQINDALDLPIGADGLRDKKSGISSLMSARDTDFVNAMLDAAIPLACANRALAVLVLRYAADQGKTEADALAAYQAERNGSNSQEKVTHV